MANEGFCYVVYGGAARYEAIKSISTLRKHHRQPVTVIGDREVNGAQFIPLEGHGTPGRWAKVNLDLLSPYGRTCYLDADTIVHADLGAGFQVLADGWDMAIAPSANQEEEWLRHVKTGERMATLDGLGYPFLQLQAGMMFFRKSEAIHALFEIWREEWEKWQDQDQGALLRALYRQTIKVWLLGQPWSNGEIVRHLFGALR